MDSVASRPSWVVETTVRAVPKDRFPAVQDRIARNVHAVEAWAPGVSVRSCLALLEPFAGRRDYEAGDGTAVVLHDEKSLRTALRAERAATGW